VEETQNLTLSLPRDLIKQVKRVAVERDTSISALLRAKSCMRADRSRALVDALRNPFASR
jgi:hypothetical protein